MATADDAMRMIADLGLARRDLVSAPEADSRGRRLLADPRLSEISKEYEDRRARIIGGGPQNDERADKLRKWNSNFERDAITDQLENRYSGQGHRAALTESVKYDSRWEGHRAPAVQKPQYDPHWEKTEVRYGEERRLYLQERANDSKPAPNPNRAPSPRAQGTTRFVHGNRVGSAENTSLSTTGAPTRSSAGIVRHPATAPVRAVAPARAANIFPPTGSQVSHYRKPVASPVRAVEPSSSSTTSVAMGSHIREQIHKNTADHHAANPGEECDVYYAKNPEQKQQYLRPAQMKLVKEAFKCTNNPAGRETQDYLEIHKDRKWMFEAAMKARDMVVNHSQAEADAYFAAQPAHMADFGKAAKHHYTPKIISAAQTPAAQGTANTLSTISVNKAEVSAEVPATQAAAAKATKTSTIPKTVNTTGITPALSIVQTPTAEAATTSPITHSVNSTGSHRGWLRVLKYNVTGLLEWHKHFGIKAPVQLSVDVTAMDSGFDVRSLVGQIEELAHSLPVMGAEFKAGDDGIYEE